MTDTQHSPDDPAEPTSEPEEANEPSREPDEPGHEPDESDQESERLGVAGRDIRRYAEWGAFGVCALLGLIAALQLYLSVDQLVAIWVAPRYEPAFRAAFNLVVLLLAGYGTFTLADRLNRSE